MWFIFILTPKDGLFAQHVHVHVSMHETNIQYQEKAVADKNLTLECDQKLSLEFSQGFRYLNTTKKCTEGSKCQNFTASGLYQFEHLNLLTD